MLKRNFWFGARIGTFCWYLADSYSDKHFAWTLAGMYNFKENITLRM